MHYALLVKGIWLGLAESPGAGGSGMTVVLFDSTLLIRIIFTVVFATCVYPASYRNHRHRSPSPSVSVSGSKNSNLALPWIFYHRFLAGFFNPNTKPGASWTISKEEDSGTRASTWRLRVQYYQVCFRASFSTKFDLLTRWERVERSTGANLIKNWFPHNPTMVFHRG